MKITQPVGQQRQTNVAKIKYKVHKKKFEIACYKNKAINWRNGVEKDINEVLQAHEIFVDTSKGQIASQQDLNYYFPNQTKETILKLILEKGELEVSEKEREQNLDIIQKDILNFLFNKCVHPTSKRPISMDSLNIAINDINYLIKPDIPPKRQALQCLKKLKRKYYIERAEMRIKTSCQLKDKQLLLDELQKIEVKPEQQEELNDQNMFMAVLLIEPKKFRIINDILKVKIDGGIMETINPYVTNKDITGIEEAGEVNLQIRQDYKPGDEDISSSSDEEMQSTANNNDQKGKKFKKDRRKKKDKDKSSKKNQQQNKNEKEDNDEEEYKINDQKTNQSNKKMIIKDQKLKEQLLQQELLMQDLNQYNNAKQQQEQQLNKGVENTQQQQQQIESKFKCTSCKSAIINTKEDFRAHCKTEWHLFNQKRKIENKEPFTEMQFKDFTFNKDFQNL